MTTTCDFTIISDTEISGISLVIANNEDAFSYLTEEEYTYLCLLQPTKYLTVLCLLQPTKWVTSFLTLIWEELLLLLCTTLFDNQQPLLPNGSFFRVCPFGKSNVQPKVLRSTRFSDHHWQDFSTSSS